MDRTGISMRQAARNRVLTTTRVFQLLRLLNLPEKVIAFIESLSDRHLGRRFLTERRVRSWLKLGNHDEQMQAFRHWEIAQKVNLSVDT